MSERELLKYGVTLNALRSRCFITKGHKSLTSLTEDEVRELVNYKPSKNRLSNIIEYTGLKSSKLYDTCMILFGHRNVVKLSKKDLKKIKDFNSTLNFGLTTSELAKALGVANTTVLHAAKLMNKPTMNGTATYYNEIEQEFIKNAILKTGKSSTKRKIHFPIGKKYVETEDVPKIKDAEDDFLNKISFYLEHKYSILKILKENIDPVNYKGFKSFFEDLLKMTLETIPDSTELKINIMSRFDLKDIKFKKEKKHHECPILKSNLKSVYLGDSYSEKLSRHMAYTVGMLNDIINNYNNFYIVESNFACLSNAAFNIFPETTKYRRNFFNKFNIKRKSFVDAQRKIG